MFFGENQSNLKRSVKDSPLFRFFLCSFRGILNHFAFGIVLFTLVHFDFLHLCQFLVKRIFSCRNKSELLEWALKALSLEGLTPLHWIVNFRRVIRAQFIDITKLNEFLVNAGIPELLSFLNQFVHVHVVGSHLLIHVCYFVL